MQFRKKSFHVSMFLCLEIGFVRTVVTPLVSELTVRLHANDGPKSLRAALSTDTVDHATPLFFSHQSTVRWIPFSKEVSAHHAKCCCALAMSRHRRGCPSGFERSHSIFPWYLHAFAIRWLRSLIETSRPFPRLIGSGVSIR